jgi:hypothetical protein
MSIKDIRKPIPGFSNYSISSSGVLWSKRGRLHPGVAATGYLVSTLRGDDGKRYNKTIHRLVVAAWAPNEVGQCVNHRNGDKTDNRIENLEVTTYQANNVHALRVLKVRRAKGVECHACKLTEGDIMRIRFLWPKHSASVIAREFGVCKQTILNIVNRRKWRHIA